MDKNDYEEKMLQLLADNKTYEIDSKVNPLKFIEKELNKLLWHFVKEKITSPVYPMLK